MVLDLAHLTNVLIAEGEITTPAELDSSHVILLDEIGHGEFWIRGILRPKVLFLLLSHHLVALYWWRMQQPQVHGVC